jgi:DNA repair protein RadC
MPDGVEYRPTIRQLPACERPRERLRDHGAAALSNSELLAIVLRTGTPSENALALATAALARFGGLPGLSRAGFGELCTQHGMGEAKAAQIKAALELGRRLLSTQPEERATVRSPQDVANLLLAEMALLEQEHLRVLLLNSRNQVLAMPEVYKGNVSSAQVRISELLREAVREGCPSIIVVHNHPSGDPTPSADDVELTRKLLEASRFLDIDVLDHIVIARQGIVSLRDKGLGFAGP